MGVLNFFLCVYVPVLSKNRRIACIVLNSFIYSLCLIHSSGSERPNAPGGDIGQLACLQYGKSSWVRPPVGDIGQLACLQYGKSWVRPPVGDIGQLACSSTVNHHRFDHPSDQNKYYKQKLTFTASPLCTQPLGIGVGLVVSEIGKCIYNM